jgi:uncharacterized damage-inducible protein DinB
MSSSAASQDLTFGAHLRMQLDLPYRMITALAADFTEEQAKEAGDGRKPLVWYLGHVIIARNGLLKLFAGGGDEAVTREFAERFGRGSDGSADFSDAPGKAELLEIYTRIQERATEFVSTLAPEDMGREPDREAPHPLFKTLGMALTLNASHDAYHAGQIGVLRRAMGKDPLFG